MPLFTKENAASMGHAGAIARWHTVKEPEPVPPMPEPMADGFADKRLARVRYQLSLIDDAMERELQGKLPDGQRIDRLAAASMRLNDQEFALANRPKPAPLKMTARQSRSYQAPSSQPPPSATE